jgi:hypothetical protein
METSKQIVKASMNIAAGVTGISVSSIVRGHGSGSSLEEDTFLTGRCSA